jgi:hypothetical protein
MTLYDLLNLKYPEAFKEFPHKVLLQDDGEGVYIREWNLEGVAQPSKEELLVLETELAPAYLEQQKLLKFKTVNEEVLKKLDEIDIKSIRALRTNDAARLSSLEVEAATLRAQLVK